MFIISITFNLITHFVLGLIVRLSISLSDLKKKMVFFGFWLEVPCDIDR